jgi:protein-disulfide isomerase
VQIGAIALFAAIVVGVLVIVSLSGGDEGGGDLDAEAAEVQSLLDDIQQRGIALGDPDAPVTLTELGDLQCPFCAQYSENAFPTLVDRFVRDGDLRMEFQPLTFIGPDSEEAARMAVAVGLQGRYWSFVDLFYRQQQAENSRYVDDEYLTELAAAIPGVDADDALAQRNWPQVDEVLAGADDLAAEFGIESTPSFLLGRTGERQRVLDVASLEPDELAAAIEDELGGPNGG